MMDPAMIDGALAEERLHASPESCTCNAWLLNAGRRRSRRIPGGTSREAVSAAEDKSRGHRVEIAEDEVHFVLPLDARRLQVLLGELHAPDCDLSSLAGTPATAGAPAGDAGLGELLSKLASALREVRGHVPDRVWWDSGAADALIEYHATQEP